MIVSIVPAQPLDAKRFASVTRALVFVCGVNRCGLLQRIVETLAKPSARCPPGPPEILSVSRVPTRD